MHGTVTAVEPQERRGGRRVNVFLDGAYAFSLDAEVAAGLQTGEQLGEAKCAALLERDQFQIGLNAALGFLGHRPRSEREIRLRLARHQLSPTVLTRVLERLREWRLVDDEAFAQYWVEQRRTHRPRGERLLRAELRQRGVEAEVAAVAAEAAAAGADEDAYRAAVKRAHQLQSLDERTFRQRLAQLLARRGFDWDTIRPTVDRLWIEVGGGTSRPT